ncbi:hypothetical protein [Arthrobacter sp. B2a2-09]|uniref:hypothetical protein n=1 Tax=Arthrobacter sp. B2a2-09 TaxID=2952822 RepID=UPI0022CD2154|nr:hypothetical protein [Arthrobacter sp. B2a2-09]MCZ9884652.1 hypothetical protein [Arthrobacter sp. B2a2-09]
MRPGDFILESPTGLWGSVVASVSGGRYNHARLVVDESGRSLSAESDGAVWEPNTFEGDVVVSPPMTDAHRARIAAIADELVGTPYSRRGLVLVGLARLGLRTPWLSRELDRPGSLICSQLIDLSWRRAGFDAFADGRQPQDVTPGDLADLAFRNGWDVYTL